MGEIHPSGFGYWGPDFDPFYSPVPLQASPGSWDALQSRFLFSYFQFSSRFQQIAMAALQNLYNPVYRHLRVGERAQGWELDPAANTNGQKGPIYRLYDYERLGAEDYQFQLGQRIHNTDVSESRTTIGRWDPVILDLDGNGTLDVTGKDDSQRTINQHASVSSRNERIGNRIDRVTTTIHESDTLINWDKKIDFDIDGDGVLDRVEWLKQGAKDGLLVADLNHDGKINDGRELMGETGANGEKGKYKDGWAKARDLFDIDKNGVLEGEELKGLQIWVDQNGDGKTDPGELRSMGELGIVRIELPKEGELKGSFIRKKEVANFPSYWSWGWDNFLPAYCPPGIYAAPSIYRPRYDAADLYFAKEIFGVIT